MSQKLLLVDFENVHQVNLSHLDANFNVIIFVGATQKNVPIELVVESQKLGSRLEWQRVEGNGTNALDFFIACHLGRVLEKAADTNCIVLSKDKGFDPLLRHLSNIGLKCSRVNSLMELGPKLVRPEEPNYKKVVEALDKNRKTRPRKRKTLSQFIFANIFLSKLPQAEVDHIIDLLFAHKMITETNATISYEF